MLLCTAIATAFTACDSLIPNDPSTEEENTQGGNGNDNPGGSDGTEDETPTIVHNQKIVKLLSDEDGNIIYSFEYDDKDRLVRYSFRGENLMSYEYEENEITATPLDRHPYTYDFHFDDKGYLVSWDMLYDGKISETFTMEYKDGFLVADPGGDFIRTVSLLRIQEETSDTLIWMETSYPHTIQTAATVNSLTMTYFTI